MSGDPIRDDRRPLYERAQAVMIARITQGVYGPGDQLPQEVQLAAELGVSRTTIRTALANLEALGYIQRIHGAGTFVAQRRLQIEAQLDTVESFHPRLAARLGRSSQITHLEIREVAATGEIAAAMGLRSGEPVISVARVVEIDAAPMVHLQDFLPVAICNCNAESLRSNFNDSVIDYFDGSEGRPIIEWSDSHLGAARADDALATLLRVKPGDVLFRLDETFYADGLRLVSWSRNHIVPDYFKFHLRRRVVRKEVAAGPDM
jgi:GntR family transcriptional regulator